MYLPLRFLEMMDSYLYVPGASQKQLDVVNTKSLNWVEKFMLYHKNFFFETYAIYKDFLVGELKYCDKEVIKNWKTIVNEYIENVGILAKADEDFLNTLYFTHMRNLWRKNKLVYRVSSDLKEELKIMKMNKLVSINCLKNLPALCFYIDYLDSEGFAGNDSGCLVAINISTKAITVISTLLFDNKEVNTIIVSLGIDLTIPANEEGVLLLTDKDAKDEVRIVVCNKEVIFKEREFKKFLLNFFVYLYAVNTDVTTSEKTVNTYRQPKIGAEPKNKFSEIKGYDVGFNYVNSKSNKVKYIRDLDNSGQVKGSAKCTHYRSAHWHSYWIKEGDEKKLIVKWVDGVMVNGSEAKNVTITKI